MEQTEKKSVDELLDLDLSRIGHVFGTIVFLMGPNVEGMSESQAEDLEEFFRDTKERIEVIKHQIREAHERELKEAETKWAEKIKVPAA
jgi:hypothetical protein